jgi:hypothetical protein
MAKRKMLGPYDVVIAAWADSAAGPGWANQPVWVCVRSQLDGSHRIECLQPNEQGDEIQILYSVSQSAHRAMTGAVERRLRDRKAK